MSLAKFSLKIVKFMIFITFKSTRNRKNLVSISSTVKNVKAVIQKFVEFARVSKAVVQKRYVKIRRTCKKTSDVESLF